MEPNWVLITEILIRLKINEKNFLVEPDNFPNYRDEELYVNLNFLTEIGLVDLNTSESEKGLNLCHKLTCEGEELTDKLMDEYYSHLM